MSVFVFCFHCFSSVVVIFLLRTFVFPQTFSFFSSLNLVFLVGLRQWVTWVVCHESCSSVTLIALCYYCIPLTVCCYFYTGGGGEVLWWPHLSLCPYVHEHISGTTCQIVSKCFVYVICGCGSVLLSQHCDTLCASSFMDDIILAHNEPYAGVPVLHLNSQPDATARS